MADTIRVLYVDDEPGLLSIGKLFLEREGGFTVDTLTSVRKALTRLKTERYDVIISDYQMPEMDGIAFLKQLKASGDITPFIIFTGKGREEVVIEALNEGADFYLQKGGEPKAQFTELANKIRYAVSRRNAELDLRESEERYRHVVEDQTEFICRFLPDGTHIFVNEAYCRYFGMTRDEITGTRFHPTIHPDDRERVARLLSSLAMDHPLVTIDQRVIMPDGSIRWQRWVDRAIFQPDGRLKEYQSVGSDITDWKQAEEEIITARETYQNIFLNSQIGLFRTDVCTGLLLDANDAVARFIGYTDRASLLATPFNIVERYIDLDDHDKITSLLQSDGEFNNYEARFRKNDGSILWMRFSGRLVKEKGWVEGVSEDITERKVADMALHDSELKYRSLIESSSDAIFCVDQNGVYKFTNLVFASTFDKTPDYFIGKTFWDIYPKEHADYRQLTNSKVFETGVTQTLEVEVPLPDTTLYFIAKANPIKDETGKVILNLTHATDITERKVAEKALQESEERHRILLNDFPDPIFSFYPDGTYRHANQAFATGIGKSLDQIIGKKIWDVFQKDEAEKRFSALCTVFSTGEGKEIEVLVPHPDGDRIYVTTIIPVKDASGSVVSAICSSKDITERKQAEEALINSEEQSRNLLSQMPDIVMVHQDGIIVYGNQAAVDKTGYTREELIGSHVLDNIAENDREIIVRNMARRAAGEQVADYEIDMVHKSGALRHVIVRTSPIVFNQVPSVMIILIDITERKQAEEALSDSEEKYRLIFDHSPLGHVSFDENGVIVAVNDKFVQIIGSSREALEGLNMLDLPDKNIVSAVGKALNGSPGLYEGVYSSVTAKKITPVRGLFAPMRSGDGCIPGGVGIFEDITERKKAEEALRESGKKYQSLFTTMRLICDNVPDMIWAKDLEKRFIFVNTAICRDLLNAADTDEPIGKNDMFFAERERTRHADDHDWHMFGEICRDTDQITMDAGTPQQFDENGNVQGNYLFLDVHKAPLIDEQGQMIGTVGSARDVTISKQLETALRESEKKFRMLLLHVPSIAVQGYSMDGTTNYWYDGAENLYGYSAEEAIGKNLVELIIPPEMREEVRKAITYMAETGQPIPASELSLMKKDGTRVAVFSSHVIINRSQGEMELYCLDIDLTERKRTEEALRQANKKLNLLSSITRHDINNQLTVLQGYLSILEEQQPDATHNKYFQEIANAAKRISAMIRFTKGYEEIGVHVPVWQDCRLLVDMAAKQAALGKVKVKNNLPVGTEVFADPLIVKVFYNLVDNAVRYGGKITTIQFSTEEQGADKVIICEDDGVGVSAEEKEKIFERGFGKNTGLGLSLSLEILSITGITIKETGQPGKGARFEMTVPKGMWCVSGSGT